MTGTRDLVDQNTVFTDGPLLAAMRYAPGAVFLADEVTRLHPDEQMAMAPLLDSFRTLTVKETSEVVTASDAFRIVCTGNSNGSGDESGSYSGEKIASAAFTDRFAKVRVSYMSEANEVGVISDSIKGEGAIAEGLSQVVVDMVRFANTVRNADGSGPQLRTPISTRALVNVARTAIAYRRINIRDNILEAMRDTIFNGAPSDEAEALEKMWVNIMSASPGIA